ncbi:MAG: hypothetical protein O3A37_10870, partial [Planctomycetota bacterium]|nr:hypothetical protein [Planctomycetota bacterium]
MDSRHSLRFSNVRFISLPAFAATPVLIGMLGGGMFTRAVAVGSEANASAIGFEADIRPLLIAKCGDCHGPETQESGLRLDVRHRAMKGGDFGPVILAGNAAESELVKRITHRDPEQAMPPEEPLSAQEIAVLSRWIDAGADWPETEADRVARETDRDQRLDHWAW